MTPVFVIQGVDYDNRELSNIRIKIFYDSLVE